MQRVCPDTENMQPQVTHAGASSHWLITPLVITIITVLSIVLTLLCTSPELSWDEADYVSSTTQNWRSLWLRSDYERHAHGPMAIYLAKLGEEVLPHTGLPVEVRLRFFETCVASLGIGLLYWLLMRCFKASRGAAVVGCALLLFSIIRVRETNVIGPHYLMLVCTLGVVGLGYRWRNELTVQAAVGLGAVMAFGAVSMTYAIPVAICWAVAVAVAGGRWMAWDQRYLKISWLLPVVVATAVILTVALWPPGVLRRVLLNDFRFYRAYPSFPTLVGNRVFEATPRWAPLFWLTHLELPIVVASSSVISIAVWKALRGGRLELSKLRYLIACLVFMFGTALAAHMAGARNLLQAVGVLCLATGALFDDAVSHTPRPIRRIAVVAIVALAMLNFLCLWLDSAYTPFLSTGGYEAFLQQNSKRLSQHTSALVYGRPILRFYVQHGNEKLGWKIGEVPWTTAADAPLASDVEYVLIPALVYNDMPREQPMRRIVAEHWNLVWSFKFPGTWELRLYQNPRL